MSYSHSIATQQHHISEAELVERLRQHDVTALDYLYDHYGGALYGVIIRIIKTEEVAEEVLQDCFLRCWNKIETYDATKGRLFTWMLNIARNLAIDKTRSKELTKQKKTESIAAYVRKEEVEEISVDGIGLKEVLAVLTPEQQFVVEYLYFRGYSQSELANEFDIPLGTVKTRLRLAMQQLRQMLNIR